ncbi:MAG: serine hydroxymethyltransferase, partial [Burkholderiales bacterium]|nr:serine hydroxymethyltransferase [Anaerolineae bacterium]
ERQARYLILIASESTVPAAVREALSSPFHNLYAEGYPLDETRTMSQTEILDYNARLPEYRRIGDKRYYKGTEYADIVEALARRRAAELFAANGLSVDDLWVNVQPLSGAPANSAIYTALLNVGDTVMGMDLLHGGHLTHGSPVNRSGLFYNIVSYGINPETERLDYDQIMTLAQEHRPKMIIAGYTSYPYAPDWHKFREIADSVGAYLMADIAHVAGLVIAGMYPSPVGIADVVNFTTHKTLGGPRGAVSITHRAELAKKIDRAVFPGEQGGPHINSVAALAVSLRLAATDQFRDLQRQTAANATRLAQKLAEHGLRIPHGGTDTHLLLVDCKSIVGSDGTTLSGDVAARILDLAGIVLNRNTIPGDASAFRASGLRIGTPWITQRGFGDVEIDKLAELMATLLKACVPYSIIESKKRQVSAKIDFDTLQSVKLDVRDLANAVGIDTDEKPDDYPHVYYAAPEVSGWHTLAVRGADAKAFLDTALTSDVAALQSSKQQATWILRPDGSPFSRAILEAHNDGYLLHVADNARLTAAWLRSLSDGFMLLDANDPYAQIAGPVDVQMIGAAHVSRLRVDTKSDWAASGTGYDAKAYFIGINGANYAGPKAAPRPAFEWIEGEPDTLKTTPLHGLHLERKARMGEFAGYDMPLWYSSVTEEHLAVRTNAGIFDVTHMGAFDAQGPGAEAFLNAVTTNDVSTLKVGRSHYTYFLDANGQPLDDLMIYRLAPEHFLIVVNASNNDKNWAWLNAVKNGEVMIDANHPSRRVEGADRFTLRDLRDPASGKDQRLDVALQGPKSKALLLNLGGSEADLATVAALAWAAVARVTLGGTDLIVSRTGYTGERIAYELFVHPDQTDTLFRKLIDGGAVPAGLAARDSLRTEAGLPLYGHELSGALDLNPADAGFANYVKLDKPFFIGKAAYVAHERERDAEVVRFRLNTKGARPPHQGDPLIDERGRVVGIVTSCSIDSEGYQLGQAYVKTDVSKEGTAVGVMAGSAKAKPGKAPGELKLGDRIPMPEAATIISRFPAPKK